jgi:thioesterase domain-containing protein
VASEAALRAYRPRPLRGGAVYLRAAERRPRDPAHPERGWLRHAGSAIAVEVVPGNHLTMHEVPHVGVLAERLGAHAIAALGLPLPPSRPSTALDETPRRSP